MSAVIAADPAAQPCLRRRPGTTSGFGYVQAPGGTSFAVGGALVDDNHGEIAPAVNGVLGGEVLRDDGMSDAARSLRVGARTEPLVCATLIHTPIWLDAMSPPASAPGQELISLVVEKIAAAAASTAVSPD